MFLDAEEFCKQFPDYKVVDYIQLSAIEVGNEVQLKAQGEKIWVTVVSIIPQSDCNNMFTGKVIKEPMFHQPFNKGSIVDFETRHIFNIRLEYERF
jgi:hypothetical protein